MDTSAAIIDQTRRWIANMVIGLNLCPFAQRVFQQDRIRYIVTDARNSRTLLNDLERELKALAATPIEEVETTLLIHPDMLDDFLDFNDFLGDAENLIDALGFEGVIQLASFHPQYQFEGTEPDAVENYTNRSPYPMLHLLREESITNLNLDEDELLEIPERNIRTLQSLGREKILERLGRDAGGEGTISPTS